MSRANMQSDDALKILVRRVDELCVLLDREVSSPKVIEVHKKVEQVDLKPLKFMERRLMLCMFVASAINLAGFIFLALRA